MNQLEKALERYVQFRMDQTPEIIEASEKFHKNMEHMIQKAQFGKQIVAEIAVAGLNQVRMLRLKVAGLVLYRRLWQWRLERQIGGYRQFQR